MVLKKNTTISRDRFGHKQVKIACPIRGLSCTAKKPRWIDAHYARKGKGRCVSCSNFESRKCLQKIEKKFGKVAGIKFGKSRIRRRGRLKVLISCPLKLVGCRALSPRWIFINTSGVCRSCSNNRGGWLDQWGYRRIHVECKSVAEHRHIMSKMLGRKLRKGETVHHKNGKRSDNRKINLELRMSGNHPKGWSLRQMREYLKTIPKRLGGLK